MPGLGELLGVLEIKEMRGRPRQAEAREMLEKLRDQVHPICVAHKWKVLMLEEFMPSEAGLLGLNMNHGMKIRIRLRPSSDEGSFIPYESALDTLLHELVHNEIGPHSAKFFKKWDELRAECEKLMSEGITGRNMPFAGDGRSLGGGRAPADARTAALKAAEKRKRQQGVMPCGGHRLGGGDGEGLWGAGSGSAAQRAAAAAQRRAEISRGCGNRPQQDDREAAGNSVLDWECPACTLINPPALSWCDACGGPRSAAAAPASATGASGGGGNNRCGARAGGSSAGASGWREKRPAPATGAAAARAAKAAGVQKRAGARAASGRSLGGSGIGSGDGGSGSGTSASGGLSGLRIWTCHECPFRFPNAEERRTCETCGASRDAAKKTAGSGSSSNNNSSNNNSNNNNNNNNSKNGGGCGAVADRGWEKELPPWTCARCTVVNAGMFLLCGTCEAERPLEDGKRQEPVRGEGTADSGWAAAAQGGGSGADFSSAGGGAVGGSLGAPAAGTSDSRDAPLARVRVCRVCTLRNVSDDPECVACGIPFAESEAAAAAAAPMTGSGGNGGGGGGGVRAIDESVGGDPLGAAAGAAGSSAPEYIDLS